MKYIINFDILTAEGYCSRGHKEEFEDRDKANARYKFLKDAGWAVNITPEKVDRPARRVIQLQYSSGGTIYTFETDYPVKKNQVVRVADKEQPWRQVYCAAVSDDHYEYEDEFKFDINRLRKIVGVGA